MPDYQGWLAADNHGKMTIARKNLKENPHIAAYHFIQRFESFLKQVLIPKFGLIDYWYRLKWQAHGSRHVHSLF